MLGTAALKAALQWIQLTLSRGTISSSTLSFINLNSAVSGFHIGLPGALKPEPSTLLNVYVHPCITQCVWYALLTPFSIQCILQQCEFVTLHFFPHVSSHCTIEFSVSMPEPTCLKPARLNACISWSFRNTFLTVMATGEKAQLTVAVTYCSVFCNAAFHDVSGSPLFHLKFFWLSRSSLDRYSTPAVHTAGNYPWTSTSPIHLSYKALPATSLNFRVPLPSLCDLHDSTSSFSEVLIIFNCTFLLSVRCCTFL